MIRYWIEKLDKINRFRFFGGFVALLVLLLIFRLFQLTIIQGSHWREVSENKRAKDLVLTAPRGEIRDRNGLLIAGNKPVYTVELRKDELDKLDREEKNRDFYKLVHFLEEDGANVVDDFPLVLNDIDFKSVQEEVSIKEGAMDMFIAKILDNDLLPDLVDQTMQVDSLGQVKTFFMARECLRALGQGQAPIRYSLNGMTFNNEEDQADWLKANHLDPKFTAKEALVVLLRENPTALKKVLSNAQARKLAFDLVASKGLAEPLTLRAYANKFDKDYKKSKMAWMDSYPEITLQSSAKEDFLTIFKDKGAGDLAFKKSRDEEDIQAKKDLVKVLNKQGKEKIKLEPENKEGIYRTKEGKNARDYVSQKLMDLKVLETWLEEDSVRNLAQEVLIDQGIYTGISIADGGYKYVSLKNKEDFYQANKLDPQGKDQEAFQGLRDKYDLSPKISPYDARGILNLYYELNKQGNLAYLPIIVAYKIQDQTVARISENFSENPGIAVASKPIRAYPLGKTAAHILGYLGKISSEEDIKKYTKKGYERDAIIGKTGIEESFESYLHGKNGRQRVQVDAKGNTTAVLDERPPVAGKNVYLSIDLNLQKKAEEVLAQSLHLIQEGGVYESQWGNFPFLASRDKGRPYIHATSGAVMAVDVKTGKVLCMANFPSYDPNLFATGISSVDWESLIPLEEKNPLAARPLYNIPFQTAVQPGSIFKMVTALAAMEKGLDPNMAIPDGGYVDVGGSIFGCWLWNQSRQTHGDETLKDAIRDSCNYYFFSLGLGEDQRRGEKLPLQINETEIKDMAEKFGLGKKTGMEITMPAEAKGTLPDPKQKKATMKQLLRNLLDQSLKEASNERLTEEKQAEAIKALTDLMDKNQAPSRQEVVTLLEGFNIDPNHYLKEKKRSLVDCMVSDYYNQANWSMADTMNITIGQGANSYTLAQMTRYAMALANGGKLYPLSLVQEVKDENNAYSLYKPKAKGDQVKLNRPGSIAEVTKGMQLAALANGNDRCYKNFPVEVAIKTGTAERAGVNPYTGESYDSFSWQIGFAPYKDPEIAVAAVLFQGGSGMNCGPILRGVMAEYFGLNKQVVTETLPIENQLTP